MIRTVVTRFAFNGLPKDFIFTYDPEVDIRIANLVLAGYLADITPEQPETIVFYPAGIDSDGKVGDIGGQGADQPHAGGRDGAEVEPAAGEQGVSGDEGAGPKVAKGRKPRTDVSTDGQPVTGDVLPGQGP